MTTPLHWLTAHELGERLRSGRCSAREATDHCLARISQLDAKLHAFVNVFADEAGAGG